MVGATSSRTQRVTASAMGQRSVAVGEKTRILSLQSVDWISGAVSTPLSLPRQIAFPDIPAIPACRRGLISPAPRTSNR
jgi:hypothetical protein